MAKATTAASRRTTRAAPKTEEFQAASETEAKSEGAAAPAGGTEVKASDVQTATDAADLAGTTDASAAPVEDIRERAEAAPTDQKGAAEEGTQPEATAQPPVAEPDQEAADKAAAEATAEAERAEAEARAEAEREDAALIAAALAKPELREFEVNWDLRIDGQLYTPDSDDGPVLTEAEFNALRASGVVSGVWNDGYPVHG